VYIDDLVLPGNLADCIINHSMGISVSDYEQLAPVSSVYAGSQYSLVNIDDKFRHQSNHKNLFSQLLIAMGGADPLNFTCKTILAHKVFIQRFEKVVVLTGTVYAHTKALQEAVKDLPQTEIINGLPKIEMLSLMQQSSAAIISASNMAVEYAHIGGALAIIQTADNQKNIYKGLIENDAAVPVETVETLTDSLAVSMQKKQQQIFDGQSGHRFIKLFKELQIQAGFSFIKAGTTHLQETYQWAANPRVRAYSFNQNPIVFEEHKNWYLKKIEQADCIYLLGKWDNNIVGSLRFDITDSQALISYLVSPQYHGKGLGRIILAKGLEYLAMNTTNVTIAKGYVMPQNIVSVKVFERLGFDSATENNQLIFSKKINR
jgi:RimJ/RimL family protein N-acetyltransferase